MTARNVRELAHGAERKFWPRAGAVAPSQKPSRVRQLADDVPATLREAVASSFERTCDCPAITSHVGRMDAVAEALGIGRRRSK